VSGEARGEPESHPAILAQDVQQDGSGKIKTHSSSWNLACV